MIEAGDSVIGCAVEEGAGFFNIFLVDRQGDVALLHDAVGGVGHLVEQHGVVLRSEAVQIISLGRNEDILFEVLAIDVLVVDGDLGGGAGIQSVQQFRVAEEHGSLILFGRDGVVDVAEPQHFRILAAKLENPVRPESANGNDVLYRSWYLELFFVLL